LRSHRNSISRYNRLVEADMTELEHWFIEKRVAEQRSALEALVGATFPIRFKCALPAVEASRQAPSPARCA
jgi:hypothetical protein